MMDQTRWNKLQEVFNNEELFWEQNWTDCDMIEGLDLQDWLECDSRSPSGRMMQEFSNHGYRVYATERDSFGWLIGAVRDKKTGKEILFG